ncbi:MAG: glutamyl-tRNA reductase [Thermoplasmatota archaeon]
MEAVTLLTWRTPKCDAQALEQATLPDAAAQGLAAAKERLETNGLFYLATCQRVVWALEGVATDPLPALRQYYAAFGRTPPEPERFDGFNAFRHMAEVANSLDSLVPGEPQVLGQVKQAVNACEKAGVFGGNLRHVFDLVLRTAKTVRSNSGLFQGKVSLIPLAEQAIQSRLAVPETPCAVIAGTGEMGQKAAQMVRRLRPDAQLHVVSRDSQRAREAAIAIGATPWALHDFLRAPPAMDVFVASMDTTVPLFDAEWLQARCTHRPLTVLDLGMPRNTELPAGNLPNLELIQLDQLTALSEKARQQRDSAVEEATRILEDEVDRVRHDYDLRCHASTLRQLAERFEHVAAQRWDSASSLDRQDPRLRKWYDQTVRALLHEATLAVKQPGERP